MYDSIDIVVFSTTMDQRIFQLPIRVLRTSRSTTSNWVCKRCLATQVDLSSNPTSISLTPSAVHDSSHGDTDDILRRALPHTVPTQYLQHSRSTHLPEAEQAIRAKITPHKKIVGVVVRAGKMHKTVTVRIPYQKWNKRIGKVGSTAPCEATRSYPAYLRLIH